MNKQTNTPELRFPEFKNVWKNNILKNMATTFSGGTPSSTNKSLYAGEIPFIRSGEINSLITEMKISQKALEKSSAKMVNEGDILYALYGATSGEVAISKIEGAINQAVLCIRTKQITSFLYQYLKLKKSNILNKYLQGGQGNLSAKIIKNIVLSMPDTKEQRKIGDFFSKLDQQIELEEKKLELLEQQKRGYMQKLFSQELRFKDKNGNQYPEWVTKKLGDIGKVAMNKRIYKNETTENGEIPFYKIGNFGKNADTFITREKFDEYKEKYPYPNVGDILISASGSIGRTIEYTGEDAYYQDSNIVWLNHNDEVINKYLKYFYKIVKWSGIEGTTIKRLYNKNILNTKIELPTVEEQYKMANFLSKLDKIIDIQIEKIELLKQRKQGLLQKMFIWYW